MNDDNILALFKSFLGLSNVCFLCRFDCAVNFVEVSFFSFTRRKRRSTNHNMADVFNIALRFSVYIYVQYTALHSSTQIRLIKDNYTQLEGKRKNERMENVN